MPNGYWRSRQKRKLKPQLSQGFEPDPSAEKGIVEHL
jgi:hypothetical protein